LRQDRTRALFLLAFFLGLHDLMTTHSARARGDPRQNVSLAQDPKHKEARRTIALFIDEAPPPHFAARPPPSPGGTADDANADAPDDAAAGAPDDDDDDDYAGGAFAKKAARKVPPPPTGNDNSGAAAGKMTTKGGRKKNVASAAAAAAPRAHGAFRSSRRRPRDGYSSCGDGAHSSHAASSLGGPPVAMLARLRPLLPHGQETQS
jgi:hypothetical protein